MRQKRKRIIFLVNVERITKDGSRFETVAKNLKLREPVWYKTEVIKREVLKQYPKLKVKLKGRRWTTKIVRWYKKR